MSNSENRAIGDMKASTTIRAGARPKLSILPRVGLIYGCRPTEYGGDKYARGNYHGPSPSDVSPIERFLGYLDAALRHITETTNAINVALGTGGDLAVACAAPDSVASAGFPPSGLPHVAHAIASLMIGVSCAAADGLLPEDPGQPWRQLGENGLPQKEAPAAERQRVERLVAELPPPSEPVTIKQSPPPPPEPGSCSYSMSDAAPICREHRCFLRVIDAGIFRCPVTGKEVRKP